MRQVRAWVYRLGRGAGSVLVFVCIVAAVAIGTAARSPKRLGLGVETQPTSRHAQQLAPRHVAERRAALAAALTFVPAQGATSVAPDAPVVVRASAGNLRSVRVTSPSGAAVDGALTSATEWRSTAALAYGTDYQASATVWDGPAVRVSRTATFHTLTPSEGVTTSVFPNTGLSVGVGQPVVFRFSRYLSDPAARAAVVRHLSVHVSKDVVGGWFWYSNRELHFRPKEFWPHGAQVTVAWDLTGWNAGNGAWGAGQGATQFSISDARVSFVDLVTHQMKVTANGKTIATFQISGGKPKDPTMGGVHIVLDRQSVVHMVSSTVGIPVHSPDGYDELVYDDVHISDSGEYVHAAPWSVASQGRANVSHGCVNLSPADAKAFFAFSRVGDVVVIAGSPRPPARGDHGVMDWDTQWPQFMPAQVLSSPPTRTGAAANRSNAFGRS